MRRMAATTPEEREDQMIALASELAERQMRDGTASAQVISFYLKLGSSREKLEQQRLAIDTELAQAKADAIRSQQRSEEMFEQAIRAMRSYQGHQEPPQAYEGGY
jgi:hypothetical protein